MKADVFGFWDRDRIFQYCVISPVMGLPVCYSPDLCGLGEYVGSVYRSEDVRITEHVDDLFSFVPPANLLLRGASYQCTSLRDYERAIFRTAFEEGHERKSVGSSS